MPGRAKQEISSHKCSIPHVKAAQPPRDDTTTANTLNTSLRRALICSAGQGTRMREVRPIQRVRAPASCGESAIHYWWVSTLESWGATARGACAPTRPLARTHHFEVHRSVQLQGVGKRHTIGSTMARRQSLCRFGRGLLAYMLVGSSKNSFCSSATILRLVHVNFQGDAKPILGRLT